jgi:dienelactone hydrolase
MVDANRIAAIGYCFGGATVQQLAYSGTDLKGIVSFHGSLVAHTEGETKPVKAKILICHGAADPLTTQEKVQDYLTAMGNSGLDWQMVFCGGRIPRLQCRVLCGRWPPAWALQPRRHDSMAHGHLTERPAPNIRREIRRQP